MSTTDPARSVAKYQCALVRGDKRAQDRLFDAIWAATCSHLISNTHARRWAVNGLSWDDIEQTLRLGLVEALRCYSPERGNFEPFACRVAKFKLYDYISVGGSVIKEKRHVTECRRLLRNTRTALEGRLGREATESEIVADAETPRAARRLRFALSSPDAAQVLALDELAEKYDIHPTTDDKAHEDTILTSEFLEAWTASGLSELEGRVLRAAADLQADEIGRMDTLAVAQGLSIEVKAVDNACQRLRRKMRDAAEDQGLTSASPTDAFLGLRPSFVN